MGENGRKVVEVPNVLTVRQLASLINASPIDIIKQLMSNGVMANINQQLDYDTAAIVIHEMGFEPRPQSAPVPETEVEPPAAAPEWRRVIEAEAAENLAPRPPVVTILGHVDHGKTSLLDVIRKTNVAAQEVGGITQHIGAYQVEHNGRKITFLDTPGHEAFTTMRMRGAQVTDIAILVVAADDGVMPQTREAIAHAHAARVPIIVALNKIDKPNANPERVKQQLAELGLTPDDWGGKTIVVPVSAKQKIGLDDLLEAILLVADDTHIRANPHATAASGTVIEAELDRARGVVTTVLVQNGTLRTGEVVVAGMTCGKIRAMFDAAGAPIKEALPSMPVTILGLGDVPTAGDLFRVVSSDREARLSVAERKLSQRAVAKPSAALSLEQVFARFQAGETRELPLIIKADVQGSLEPIVSSLERLSTANGPKVNILYAETGNITENDVMLASASNAIIIGFNAPADAAAQRLAEANGVSIRQYDIIYRVVEDVEKALQGLLEPEYKLVVVGRAEVRAVFKVSKIGYVAGCHVREGEARRNANARVLRGGKVEFEGQVLSLKREKEDVREVAKGFECGVGLKDYDGFKPGDTIEFFVLEKSG